MKKVLTGLALVTTALAPKMPLADGAAVKLSDMRVFACSQMPQPIVLWRLPAGSFAVLSGGTDQDHQGGFAREVEPGAYHMNFGTVSARVNEERAAFLSEIVTVYSPCVDVLANLSEAIGLTEQYPMIDAVVLDEPYLVSAEIALAFSEGTLGELSEYSISEAAAALRKFAQTSEYKKITHISGLESDLSDAREMQKDAQRINALLDAQVKALRQSLALEKEEKAALGAELNRLLARVAAEERRRVEKRMTERGQ